MNHRYRTFLFILAFFSGMAVMAMEIAAARLLAPYFGTSSFVWTNIIAVVLIALSIGYYVGGKLSDKKPDVRVLLWLILGAGLIFLVIPWLVKPLSSLVTINTLTIESASVVIFLGSLLVTSLLFAFPLMILGMTSPFIIKLSTIDRQDIGNTAGSIFAISTVGSIIGTFLPTLWFIPVFGTRTTITFFACLLIVLALSALISRKRWLVFLVVLLIPLTTAEASTLKETEGLVAEDESVYQYIQVVRDDRDNFYLIFNEGGGVQSIYNKNVVLTEVDYFNYFALLPYLVDSSGEKNILNIGLAGGTLSRLLTTFFPDEVRIDGVEIDRKVIDLARRFFALDHPRTAVHNQDGRMFLRFSDKKYDIIVVDAYSQELYIPWTLTTREFWTEARDHLQDRGLVAINVNATSPDSSLLQTIINTMSSVFNHTYVTKIARDGSWNYMITGSRISLPFSDLPLLTERIELQELARQAAYDTREIPFDSRVTVLTDDRAPVEFMTDAMIFHYLTQNAQ